MADQLTKSALRGMDETRSLPEDLWLRLDDKCRHRYRALLREAVDEADRGRLRLARDNLRAAEETARAVHTLTQAPAWKRRVKWARGCQLALDDLVVDRIEEVGL